MLFERFEEKGLVHYSYAVGCSSLREVAIVDPKRDIDTYLDFAETQGLEISHVLETHIHADYASGAKELAQRTAADLWLSGYDEGETYEVAFPHRELYDGEALEMGSVRLEAVHTPGHTPEHLSYLVYDTARSEDTPLLMLTGDFLFVGSLGRPDLLGEGAKRELAEQLYLSVREKLAGFPDGLEVHPAHGAGSMCGSGMGGRPMSTLGFERITNPYLDPELSEESFVHRILSDVPPFPEYYRRMKRVNSEGPKILNGLPGRRAIEAADFRSLIEEEGHVVIDLRHRLSFGGAHIPDSFGIGLDPDLSTWAAWVAPYDAPLLLVSRDSAGVEGAVRALIRVGLDDVRGYLKGGIQAWSEAGYPLAEIPQATPARIYERLQGGGDLTLLDVRDDEEWRAGHVEGALHIIGGELQDKLDQLPAPHHPIAVTCATGYRSTVAASVLRRNGFNNVINVAGGMTAWTRANLPATNP